MFKQVISRKSLLAGLALVLGLATVMGIVTTADAGHPAARIRARTSPVVVHRSPLVIRTAPRIVHYPRIVHRPPHVVYKYPHRPLIVPAYPVVLPTVCAPPVVFEVPAADAGVYYGAALQAFRDQNYELALRHVDQANLLLPLNSNILQLRGMILAARADLRATASIAQQAMMNGMTPELPGTSPSGPGVE